MKKIIAITFLLFCLAGCSKNETVTETQPPIQAVQPTETQPIETSEAETAEALEIAESNKQELAFDPVQKETASLQETEITSENTPIYEQGLSLEELKSHAITEDAPEPVSETLSVEEVQEFQNKVAANMYVAVHEDTINTLRDTLKIEINSAKEDGETIFNDITDEYIENCTEEELREIHIRVIQYLQ